MRVSLLPESVRIDLTPVDAAQWAGLTAIVRPMDVEEFMRWLDAYPGDDTARQAATVLVRKQLLGVEGVDMEGVPFDPTNAAHFHALFSTTRKGPGAVLFIYNAIMSRAQIDGGTEKNSDSPSGLDTTSSSAT